VKSLTRARVRRGALAAVLTVLGATAAVTAAAAAPPTVPGAPTGVEAAAESAGVNVFWIVPANGGESITHFDVLAFLDGKLASTYTLTSGPVHSLADPTPGATDGASVTGLTPGGQYAFEVAAANPVGPGAPSALSAPILAPTPGGSSPPGSNPVTNGATTLRASPADVDFGSETLGASTDVVQVSVTNSGASPADVVSSGVQGADAGDFSVVPLLPPAAVTAVSPNPPTSIDQVFPPQPVSGLCGTTVAAGETCTLLGLAFAPRALGSRSASVTLSGNFPTVTVSLAGVGTEGYYIATTTGSVRNFGDATPDGGVATGALSAPVAALVSAGEGAGYWLVSTEGQVYSFGDPIAHWSGLPFRPTTPIIGAADAGDGLWLASSDGAIYTVGDTQSDGSALGLALKAPIVGIAATPDHLGYWLVGADGGVFTFGDAHFFGSAGALHLNEPIVGMASTPDGGGYWLVASDGGVFTFGDAAFYGSTGGTVLDRPIVGITPTPDGGGYWLVASDGGIFTFGDAPYLGSDGGTKVADAVGMVIDGSFVP